jgi:hypothetical protein
MKVAINIKTEDWNRIIFGLKNQGWKLKSKYNGFDSGIDFDFLILKKEHNQITFGWDNWFEGEIKCSNEMFNVLSQKFHVIFEYGKPNNLKSSVVILTKSQILFNRFIDFF